jgi:hypothetical protein
MMDSMDDLFREPLEVYEAAIGNPEPLAKRIESGAEMTGWERVALVAFLRGELVPPKRGRGQSNLPHLESMTKEKLRRQRIRNSAAKLRHYMDQLRERGEHYGNFAKVLDHVAEQDKLSEDEVQSVNNHYRKGRENQKGTNETPAGGVVLVFHKWLLRTGRLPELPQPVSHLEMLYILDGEPENWYRDLLDEFPN